MKKVIFRFPIALMNRLTYSRKMLVVATVFLIPIVIATYQLINLLQANIALTQNELKGNAYLGPTLALLQHVQQHRGATATFLSGDESFGAVMQQKQAAIAEDLRAVDEVDQQYGAEFGLQSDWATLRQEWLDLQGAAAGLTRAESFTRHTELIRKILDYRIAIADATALSLDPEADTYHLMMAVVQEIPDASEFLGQARATGSAAVTDGSLNEEERLQLQSLAVLAQWRITGARRSTQSVIEANPSLSERLAGPMDQAQAQGQAFLELLDTRVINAASVTITSAEYFDAATATIDAQFTLVKALAELLSERLTARAERLAQQRLLALSVAVLPVLLAVWLFAGFYFSAIEALQRTLRAAAGIAEGDLNQRIEVYSRDEVGQMAQTFSRMIDYLNGMAEVATQISEGDLTAHVQPRSEQDVLGNVFVHMLTNLRRLIGQAATNARSVGVASHQLATTAEQAGRATAQIATTVQQVASGVAQQTEHVSRTANSMEQMRRAIEGVAKGAQEQSQAVAQASGVVGQLSSAVEGIRHGAEAQAEGAQRAEKVQALLAQSLTQVREVTGQVAAQSAQAAATAVDGAQLAEANVGGIRRVYATTEQLAQRVRDLGKRSGQIGSIVETIDDIAAQTNLLALNAAIEAARAGEHGKGFAVVADEVRKLAERAASATKEITEMIRLIQSGANEVSETMQTAGDEVSKSVKLTEEAGAAFQTITSSARGVSDQIQAAQSAIAAMQAANEKLEQVVTDVKQVAERNRLSAQDMATLNTRVVESLDEVSAVVEENTAATEQMAASATEVTHAVENIASVSEENSAAAEQVSASTEEMSAQVAEVTASAQSLAEMAQALQEFVGQFKLSEMDTTALTANVETFKQAHLNWLKRAKTMMAGGATFTVADVPAHTDCAFGQWYYGRAAHEFGSLPEYTALDAPHRDFHAHLKALVVAQGQGQRNKASDVLRRLEAASTEVVIGLTALEQAITRKPATRRVAGSESVRSREAVLN